MADACADCGATRFPWMGGSHHCPAKFTRRRWESNSWLDVPEPHTIDEYETHWLTTGKKYCMYTRS
jgi:hypothetical protein